MWTGDQESTWRILLTYHTLFTEARFVASLPSPLRASILTSSFYRWGNGNPKREFECIEITVYWDCSWEDKTGVFCPMAVFPLYHVAAVSS